MWMQLNEEPKAWIMQLPLCKTAFAQNNVYIPEVRAAMHISSQALLIHLNAISPQLNIQHRERNTKISKY